MANEVSRKWFHKMMCWQVKQVQHTEDIAVDQQIVSQRVCVDQEDGFEHEGEEEIRITFVHGVHTSRLNLLEMQIINDDDNTKWNARTLRSGRRVRSTAVSQYFWRAWNPVTGSSNDFTYIFGKPDPSSPGAFLFVYADSYKVKLRKGTDPSEGVSTYDDRIFESFRSPITRKQHFKHVATGRYVGTGSRGKLRLVTSLEDWTPWVLDS